MSISYSMKALLIMGLSVVFSFVVLEGAVRVYSKLFFPKMMILDDRLGWKHSKNLEKTFVNEYGQPIHVRQNSFGHRGKEVELEKRRDTFRVLVLGDSFTEAIHVDEEHLFTTYIENLIPGVETINTGVSGYSTVQEFLYLQDEGMNFSPDLVLLMVFENDFSENCLSAYPPFGPRPYAVTNNVKISLREHLDPREFIKYTIPFPFRYELSRYSYVYYFLNTEVYHKLRSTQIGKYVKADGKAARACGRYQVFQEMILGMKSLVEGKGSAFAMVLIPRRTVVEKGGEDIYVPIEKFCQEETLQCLFLLNSFEMSTRAGLKLYFPIDIHWTADGHRVAGEEIANFILPITTNGPSK